MGGAAVWRANFNDASLTAVFVDDGTKESALTTDEVKALEDMITKEVPKVEDSLKALERIKKLSPPISGNEASALGILKKGRAENLNAYQKALADQIKSLACSSQDKDALYIVRGLTGREWIYSIIKDTGAEAPGLVEAIVSPKVVQECPVSAALTEADKAALEKLKNEANGTH